ncbi:MAG: CPBP family glutamic-type intramembrane protease [Hyphomonadaceae bacterium]|nr:CPBP family glutamic-type intramembrane protease [Hyphomonadaceae bacterium]
MAGFVRRRPATCFYVLAVLIVCAVMANGIVVMSGDADAAAAFAYLAGDIANAGGYVSIPWIARFVAAEPSLAGVLVFAAAPSIAALTVAAASGRLGRLAAMLRPWNDVTWRRGLGVYAAILIVYAAGAALFGWMTWRHGGDAALREALTALGTTAFGVSGLGLFFGMFLDEGGTLEELGWRGFLQDVLSEKCAPLATALLVGVLWWAWHLPREALTILSGAPLQDFVVGQSVFLVLCLALSIVIAAAWNAVGGSVWVAIMIHGGTNVWSKAFGEGAWAVFGGWMESVHPLLRALDLRTTIVIVLALALFAALGPRIGRRT